jgi:hypothetical protein
MAFEPFNLVGGLTIGIPPIPVINENGVATLNGLQVTGLSNLGSVSNLRIFGGNNGYFLQTDGDGNLTWAPGGNGGGGNGNPGGANTQVQFNNAGSFGGDAGFTYDSITNILSVSGNIVSNNFIGSGNITIARITANGNVTANYFIGNGSQLTGIIAASANSANFAGNITVGNQPNITSVGNLSSLTVTGNVTANYYYGNGAFLTGVGNANYTPLANFANFAGNITVSNQPNITAVGTLTNLSVSGNANVGNLHANLVTSNLIPNSNVTYNIGNNTNRWKDLYLSGNTIYLGNVTLDTVGNDLSINGGNGNFSAGNIDVIGNLTSSNIVANQYLTTLNANVTGTANFSGPVVLTPTANLNVQSNVNFTSASNVTLGPVGNIKIAGGIPGYFLRTDGSGNLSWAAAGGGGNGTPGGNTTEVQYNDNGTFGASANFTYNPFSYTLTIPTINTTTISIANTLTVNTTANLFATNITGVLTASSNVNMSSSPNVNLGSVANVKIQGGTNGYVLSTDGTGNLTWTAGGGGGNGTPGGSNTQIQFNNAGLFGGSPNFTWDNANLTMQVAGSFIANSVQMGAGAFKWSKSFVYFASTASAALDQVIYSIPVLNVSGVEFEIMATEPAGPSRQFCKISSIYYNGSVQYNEYATLIINGGVGNFGVDYNPGSIIVAPSLELKVSPSSANPITYKMLITVFAE